MLKYLIMLRFIGIIYKKWWIIYIGLIINFIFLLINSVNLFYWSNLFNFLGLDFLRLSIILLRVWIRSLIILARYNLYIDKKFYNLFILNLLFLLICLLLTFRSMDIFYFYVFFEIRILPVLLIIIGWGYQPERIQAGIYLIFYTLFVSLPLLLGIFYVFYLNYSFRFLYFNSVNLVILYFLIIMAFLVKIPIFLVHLWLPKAHVEGPVSRSIILAGIILKLGGYGLIRLMKLLSLVSLKLRLIWIILSLVGGIIISLLCLHLIDIKLLVAYSSVVHIALVIAGILSLTYYGFMGRLILIIGHGLCSSGLFVLINLIYERLGSRRLIINKGLINLLPNLSLWWFLFLSSNIAAPPSINLFGEITLFIRIISWSNYSIIFLILISFFRARYRLYLFSYRQHGKIFKGIFDFRSINLREYILLIMHWLPLNLLILKIDYFFFWIYLNNLS